MKVALSPQAVEIRWRCVIWRNVSNRISLSPYLVDVIVISGLFAADA
jgi:hypothetical protein